MKRQKSTEEQLQERAIANGPEAFSMSRIEKAENLHHVEPFREFTLEVRGGLGSLSVGTSAVLIRDGKIAHRTINVTSWVWHGKQAALESARHWAVEVLGEVG